MPTPLRRRLRLARRGLGYCVAIALVLLALAIGIVNHLLPLAEQHPERIADWLSERAGRSIAFDGVQASWTRRGPLLQLEDLRIGATDDGRMVAIGDAEMLLSMYAGLLPDTPFSELRLRNVDLTLERLADGRWQVRGLPGQRQAGGDPLEALEGLGEMQVIDGRLAVVAPALGIDTVLPHVDLRLRVDDERLRAGLHAWMRSDGPGIDAQLDFHRDSGDGRVHVGSEQVDLAAWSSLLRMAGIGAEAGQGRMHAWARLQGRRVVMLTIDGAISGLHLRGASLRDANGRALQPMLAFEQIQARARWKLVDGGWRLDAPRLRITTQGRSQTLDGLLLAAGERYVMRAERLDAGPLLMLVALSERTPVAWRRWLVQAHPRLRLQDVQLAGRRGAALRASARILDLGFAPVGDKPGLHGVSGRLRGDDQAMSLVLDADTPVRIDWPRGFGVEHVVRLDGTLVGWRQGRGWQLAASRLQVQGNDFALQLRGGLHWQGDGTRPRIDLAASAEQAPLSAIQRFLPRHRVPEKALDWMKTALQDGQVRQLRAVVAGDLDDWPFRAGDPAGQGVLQARARVENGVVKFHPDWPAAEQVQGEVRLVGDSLQVDGSGMISGARVDSIHVDIDHFRGGRLQVQASGNADAAQLLALLRDSPVQERHGETLDNLVASGPAKVEFALSRPLRREDGAQRIEGEVVLDGARLEEKRWDLVFEQVRGRVDYDAGGFSAEALQVRHEGQPGRLSLRAGSATRDEQQAFEAELAATFAADALLALVPQLDWLEPHVDGRSPWTLALDIARKAGTGDAASSRLQLRSDLRGTVLDLPAPLHKPAAAALPTMVDIDLPFARGEVQVAFGQRMALRARSNDNGTGIRVVLGKGEVAAKPPVSGLVVAGQTPELAAMDWLAMLASGRSGGDKSGGDHLPLRSIDVRSERLLLLGGVFADTRVQASSAGNGDLSIAVDGAALQGRLQVPAADGAAISGQFARLHWRSASDEDAPDEGAQDESEDEVSASATADTRAIDPAQIPPLQISVDDLRVKQAALGSAQLRTRPVAAGMSIEQLSTQAPDQRLQVSGAWLGQGAGSRTRVDALIDSDDFGVLLTGLGFGGRLAGGEGRVRFQAAWSGTPAAFELANVEGALVLGVRNGRLLQIEPGAGRVLGLLSIAELPRRLTLDFRDFFAEGFAFNRIDGQVRIGGGLARSDDLVIDGPAAEIRIHGAADLRAETFDQTIRVLPKAGNVLTVVGAIAGGPVGAAIGAAANAVLSKPLGQATAKTYHVTGPWKDPEVEVASREQSRVGAAKSEVGSGE